MNKLSGLRPLTHSRTVAGHTWLHIWTGSGSPGRSPSRQSSRLWWACRGHTMSPGGPSQEGGSRWAQTSWRKRCDNGKPAHMVQYFENLRWYVVVAFWLHLHNMIYGTETKQLISIHPSINYLPRIRAWVPVETELSRKLPLPTSTLLGDPEVFRDQSKYIIPPEIF